MKNPFHAVSAKFSLIIILFCSILLLPSHKADEGMFPLNYLNEAALKQAGLKLSVKEVFDPGKVALTNALVKVGGCTGSFISDEGIIITNHHCVYGGVAALSTADHNYLRDGFVAADRSRELPIDMPCRITESYEDVTSQVLQGIDENTSASTRAALIRSNIGAVVASERSKFPELTIEVSEMFVGKSYMLFRYFLIPDVRLVYAPPASLGQFGGDKDNWEWPRHGADFGLVRAYVGKDGKPAKFSPDNLPYRPAKKLKINPNGTHEGDFVFIMGYPGRTFRHETAPYMKYQQDVQLPMIQQWYKFVIDQMRESSKNNQEKFLQFAGTIQSLENVEKNYRGKIQGLRRTGLVAKKYEEEEMLLQLISENPQWGYEAVIPKLRSLWEQKTALAPRFYTFQFLESQSNAFAGAVAIAEARMQYKQKNLPEAEKKKLLEKMTRLFTEHYTFIDDNFEKELLFELMRREYETNNNPLLPKGRSAASYIKTILFKDKLLDDNYMRSLAKKDPKKLMNTKSELVNWYIRIAPDIQKTRDEWRRIDEEIKSLMPKYLEVKEKLKSSQFIPDANSTLRLTYGYIKSFSPNDGETHKPFTTLKGVFEKANTAPDYELPQVLSDNLRVANVPKFFTDPETGEVIVNFLYNLDTTGGNSGSPVLDANGDLIGVNFDRAFTATINDYAWNDQYSRSIGCDIRYVIYIMKYIGHADHLLKEIGVAI